MSIWIHTNYVSCFLPLSRMCTSVFDGMSVFPMIRIKTLSLEWHLCAIWKNSNSRALYDTGFYWSSANALHQGFAAEWQHWVWIEKPQLTAQCCKRLAWIQLYFQHILSIVNGKPTHHVIFLLTPSMLIVISSWLHTANTHSQMHALLGTIWSR